MRIVLDKGTPPTGAGGMNSPEAVDAINEMTEELYAIQGSETIAGGAGFVDVSGSVSLDLGGGARHFHQRMTGGLSDLAFINVPDTFGFSASWTWVLRIDDVGGYAMPASEDRPDVTFVDGRSFDDADTSADAENIFTFWTVGSKTYGALITNGTVRFDPHSLSFAGDEAQLLPVVRAETLELGAVTHLEADGTAGTGTLSYKRNGSTVSGPTAFEAGQVLEVTLTGSSAPSCISIPRTQSVAASGSQVWGVESLTVSLAAVFADTDLRIGRRFTVGASALDMNSLRVYAKDAGTYRVTMHRFSDGVEMESVDIVVGAGEVNAWASETFTPVTLEAATDYVVSVRCISPATVDIYQNPASIAYHPAHTHVEYRYGSVVDDTMPDTVSGATHFIADFGFIA